MQMYLDGEFFLLRDFIKMLQDLIRELLVLL